MIPMLGEGKLSQVFKILMMLLSLFRLMVVVLENVLQIIADVHWLYSILYFYYVGCKLIYHLSSRYKSDFPMILVFISYCSVYANQRIDKYMAQSQTVFFGYMTIATFSHLRHPRQNKKTSNVT